ncbi:MAG: aminotransferase class I/II-fold pyridoxal phosphate-dependent enzyme [Oscillospiraceae bacterium]
MEKYTDMTKEELREEFANVKAEYAGWCNRNLSLDMSRGKPGPDQMDLSTELFEMVNEDLGYKNRDGIDCRNYGGLDGLSELKALFAHIMDVSSEQVIVGGNSSLNMMFDTIAQAMTHGLGADPWMKQEKVKFICPVPGYDRHFAICEYFGIEMISVDYKADGPDMDRVEELVRDPAVKGMWCVPKYSNPDGIVYSDETVKRIASLKPAASDFKVMWDNAYAVHYLSDKHDILLPIYDECKKNNNENMVIIFASTSKITFPGAGVAAEAASPAIVALLKNRMSFQTIGPDKLNQLRHARLFCDIDKVHEHMNRHAEILRDKFKIVSDELDSSLSALGIANWSNPNGGYFISMFVVDGCAKRTVELCKKAGLVLTSAGAAYPYGIDPHDSNIRIAPTYPLVPDLKNASALLCTAVKYAVLEKLLADNK